MVWTHGYDLLVKLVVLALTGFLLYLGVNILEDNGVTTYGPVFSPLLMLSIIGVFIGLYWYIFRTLSSYLYARFTLGMDISYSQAKQFNRAFTGLIPFGKWLPMTEVLYYPPEERYEKGIAILRQYETGADELKRIIKESTDRKPVSKKVYEVVAFVVVVGGLAVSMMNVPPASYITLAFMKLTDGNSYYPLLNFGILMIIPGIILFRIERRMKD